MTKTDPYADLGEVYAAEISAQRLRSTAQPTPKAPTEGADTDGDGPLSSSAPELTGNHYFGVHIDGDKRYQER